MAIKVQGTTVIDDSRQLSVTGISTLGTLQISSGIVTATSGVVTYYGDGSNLTGVSASPGGSDGQIQYNNGGSFGGAAQLYYDDVNNRLGLNASSPAYTLDLGESASTIRLVSESGGTAIRIGDGNGNDITLLRVDGATANHDGESDSANYGYSFRYLGSGSGNNNKLQIVSDNQEGTAVQAFTMLQDGKIGIANTTPSTELDVGGTITATNYTGKIYIDESADDDAEHNLVFIDAAYSSGDQGNSHLDLEIDSGGITFNPSTNTLTVPNIAGIATGATRVYIDESADDDAEHNLVFIDAAHIGGTDQGDNYLDLEIDSGGITFNPSTNTLTVPTIVASLTGVASSATKVYVDESEDDDANYHVMFSDVTPGGGNEYRTLQVDTNGIQFNPSSNHLKINGDIAAVAIGTNRSTNIDASVEIDHNELVGTAYTNSMVTDYNGNIRITADEPTIELIGSDDGSHAASIYMRNVNEGYAFINNPATEELELKSFTASANAFHATGSNGANLSSLNKILRIGKDGNIGVGNTDAAFKLDVDGGVRVSSGSSITFAGPTTIGAFYHANNADTTLLRVTSDGSTANLSGDYGFTLKYLGSGTGNNNALQILSDNQNAGTQVPAFTMLQDGKIGIANTTPTSALDVNGSLNVASTSTFQNNVTISGAGNTSTITGPSNLVLDPAAVGDATGTVIILGNLQVDGTQTVINSTTMTVDDLNITLASGAADSAAANGAGLTVDGASATLTYASTGDKWVFNKAPYYNTNRILTTADEGSGNGLDADTLDGLESTKFLRSNVADTKTSGDLSFSDTVEAKFGDHSDLRIYHNSHSYLIHGGASAVGNLIIRNTVTDQDIVIQADDDNGSFTTYLQAEGASGELSLHHYGSKKIATKAYGIDVTGRTETDDLNVSGVSTLTDIILAGSANSITFDPSTNNSKRFFIRGEGNGGATIENDDEMYVSSTHLYIQKPGGTTTMAEFIQDGAVKLNHNNSTKLETTTNGITVTGSIVKSGGTSSQYLMADGSVSTGGGGGGGGSSLWTTTGYTGIGTTSSVGIGTIIEIIPYDTQNSGTLSFEGSAGQLFSITNQLTSGSIFSVNDISGMPSIDVNADGTVLVAPHSTTEKVGVGTTSPSYKMDVVGDINFTGTLYQDGSVFNPGVTPSGGEGAVQFNSSSNLSGISTLLSVGSTTFSVGIGTIIDIKPYDTQNGGTLSFEGSAGQLFSITNQLSSGSIFSVNDISGMPSIDVNADGTIQLAPVGAGESVGIGTTNPKYKLHVVGNTNIDGTFTVNGSPVSGGGGSVAGSDGQIQYNNNGSFGGAAQLYYDDTNNRLGINSSTPTSTLDVNGGLNVSGVSTYANVTSPSGSDSRVYSTTEGGATSGTLVLDGKQNVRFNASGFNAWILNGSTGDLVTHGTTYKNLGNTSDSGGRVGNVYVQTTVDLIDDAELRLGTGDDLKLYHDGNNSYIDNKTGDLIFRTTASNTERLRITNTGIGVSGNIEKYDTLVGSGSTTVVEFTVTVATKSDHRYIGGVNGASTSGYYLDGIESPFLTFTPGRTYRFNQTDNSNSNHQIRFYLEADKTTEYTENVVTHATAGGAGAFTQIAVTESTPSILYYQCVNHAYMGNAAQTNGSTLVDGRHVAAPNATVPVHSLSGIGTETNIDVALVPKGSGAFSLHIPDGTSTGGNKRGEYAVDLQLSRSSADNVAAGDYSFIGAGIQNKIGTNSSGSGIIVGDANEVGGSSSYCAIVGGYFNRITNGFNSIILSGSDNKLDSDNSVVIGGYKGTTKGIHGIVVLPASNKPLGTGATHGGVQSTILNLARQTTDATSTVLSSDNTAASTDNQLVLSNNSAVAFKGTCIAGVTGAGNTKAWEFRGAIKRGANAASTTLVGSVIKDVLAYDAGAAAWDVDFTADTTNGAIKVEVTGQASNTIRWVCKIETTELAF